MKNQQIKLQTEQLDKKIKTFSKLMVSTPPTGWIKAIRTSLGMSLAQLGNRMGITAQSVMEIEQREKNGSISLRNLDEVARALGLKLTYGFSAPEKNLTEMIKYQAHQTAKNIVLRTNKTMQLEDQANSEARLKKAIKEKTEEIVNKRSKYLWD